jgi:FMN phosphatase YigB (HAD superfamily)
MAREEVKSNEHAVLLLLFDYGGVLVESPLERMRQYGERYGIPGEDAVNLVFGGSEDGGTHPWMLLEKGAIDFAGYRRLYTERQSAASRPLPCPTLDEIYDLRLNTPLLKTIAELSRKGWSVGVATNNVAEKRDFWLAQVRSDMFNVIFDSSRIGFRKPEEGFYEDIMRYARRTGVPEYAVCLVDDVSGNIDAARAFGMMGLVASGDLASIDRQVRKLLGLSAVDMPP